MRYTVSEIHQIIAAEYTVQGDFFAGIQESIFINNPMSSVGWESPFELDVLYENDVETDNLNHHLWNFVIEQVCYDTRTYSGSASMFVALPGEHRDGHEFVQAAYDQGIRVFLVKREFEVPATVSGIFFFVEDPLKSLQDLAIFHRKKCSIPVVGITGSNGKTIVKEWLSDLLREDFLIHKSPRSFNSQLGVALSILGIEKHHQMAVIEAGISRKGEMKRLWEMIRPSLTVLTGLGSAHDEGFNSLEEKAAEKMLLCKDADVVVFPSDVEAFTKHIQFYKQLQPLTRFISWGKSERSSFKIIATQEENSTTCIDFSYRAQPQSLNIPFFDSASVQNAMSCFSVLFAFERWDKEHLEKFNDLQSIGNRLSIERGKRGNVIVNDSYSMDFESLIIALDTVQNHSMGKPILPVLTLVDASIRDQLTFVRKLKEVWKQRSIERIIWIGNLSYEICTELNQSIYGKHEFYPDVNAFLLNSDLASLENKAILIKGARKFRLEQITDRLKGLLHKTVMEVNLDAVRANYHYFRSHIGNGVKMMVMVKAQGYGSGSHEVASVLQDLGVDYLGVAYADEGVALREAGIKTPIMVLNTDAYTLELLDKYHLEPVIYSSESLNDYIFERNGKPGKIHIELDTGMHRLGFEEEELKEAMLQLPSNIRVQSVFTHFSVSEEAERDEFTRKQASEFINLAGWMEWNLDYPFLRHICNTAGIIRFKEFHFDMVRLGLGLYGLDPSGKENDKLHPTAALYAVITQMHRVEAGKGIGYGQNDVSEHDRRIATISMGYADGLSRIYSRGVGRVYLNGKLAPFVGNICMDMAMIDVTDIDCVEGDKVEIFGPHLSIHDVARWGNTISYEILTGISQRVPRVFVGE